MQVDYPTSVLPDPTDFLLIHGKLLEYASDQGQDIFVRAPQQRSQVVRVEAGLDLPFELVAKGALELLASHVRVPQEERDVFE